MKKSPVVVLCLLVLGVGTAQADLYSFENITNNNPVNAAAGEAQLFVDVWDVGGGEVGFRFFNTGPADSSITDVYFDDGALLGIGSIINGSGVSFSELASPSDLPGGKSIVPPFDTTEGFSADSESPIMMNGVNPGEELDVLFDLQAGRYYSDVLGDLNSRALRIGIHVQGFADGGSEAFVNNGTVVPLPGALLLGFLGLGASGLSLRRFT